METVFEKFGLTDALIVSRAQLKQIAGGADPNPDAPVGAPLHCRCVGSVGCWYYPGVTSITDINHTTLQFNFDEYCYNGMANCAFHDIC